MRFTLPESSHRRQRSAGGTVLSAALHAAAIGGTLVATGMSAEGPRTPAPPPEVLVYVKPRPVEARTGVVPPPVPVRPAVVPDLALPVVPPPHVVVDATVVPSALPDVGASLALPFDATPRSASGGASGAPDGPAHGGAPDGAPLSALAVDREVVALRGTVPRYPSVLANAGVEGTVLLQFVVDTLGRVEPGSVTVLRADHPLFAQSVREALTRMRFVPAEAAGRKVRQLVDQPFTFALRTRE
jgi:protein TonB